MTSAPCACASTPPGSSAPAAPLMLSGEQSAVAWAAASGTGAPGAHGCTDCRHSSAGDPRPAIAHAVVWQRATAPYLWDVACQSSAKSAAVAMSLTGRAVRGTTGLHQDGVQQCAPSAVVYGDSQAAVSVQCSSSRSTASLLASLQTRRYASELCQSAALSSLQCKPSAVHDRRCHALVRKHITGCVVRSTHQQCASSDCKRTARHKLHSSSASAAPLRAHVRGNEVAKHGRGRGCGARVVLLRLQVALAQRAVAQLRVVHAAQQHHWLGRRRVPARCLLLPLIVTPLVI